MTTEGLGHENLGQAWLEAATTGGLPEPSRSRWQPMRVGIVSLWEYDNAEFWFADGRLVLRGGNGAGKTKVLELTTLMLMRGEIVASVLDPFGSQHRSMRFNLLPTGDGDDPREPADAGLGYAWVEFGRREESGQARFFVCGMGASARRGSGTVSPSTWHFLTAQRPGKDFTLLAGGRAIEQKDLKKIDGVSVPPSAAAYRARLADELFGLSSESYDNVTELLKQLRKPKLGERLNPTSLAETLREALPPLAGHEITQLAEGWEHLEQLRRAVEQTEQAATEVAKFVRSGWKPWARIVLRRRADELTGATTILDNTTRAKNEAQKTLRTKQDQVATAEVDHRKSTQEREKGNVELRELLESQSYRDASAAASRVESLRTTTRDLQAQCAAARKRLLHEEHEVKRTKASVEKARREVERVGSQALAAGEELTRVAGAAGLDESVRRHLPDRDVEALTADYGIRQERFAHLRDLRTTFDKAANEAERSAQAVEQADRAFATATEAEAKARDSVAAQVNLLQQRIRDWAEAATVAQREPAAVESWCDSVTELTVLDEEAGVARPGSSVVDELREHVDRVRGSLVKQREELRLRQAPLVERRAIAEARLIEVRGRAETVLDAPSLWRRRDRPELSAGLGAPFWRLVNPVPGVEDAQQALVEAALGAAGVLDAWLTPDGNLSTVDGKLIADVQPVAVVAEPSRTLLEVLEPDPAGGVDAGVVRRVLQGIRWFDTRPDQASGDWLAADGSWRVGGLTGRAEAEHSASYLGTAAREAARQREIARLSAELSQLDEQLAGLADALEGVAEALRTLDAERRSVPANIERELNSFVTMLAERARHRLACARESKLLQDKHSEALTRRDDAWAGFADYAGTHLFGLNDIDSQAKALGEFARLLGSLRGLFDLLDAREEALDVAEDGLTRQEADRETAADEVAGLTGNLEEAEVRLRTAESALGGDSQTVLRRKDVLDEEIKALGTKIEQLSQLLSDAKVAVGRAEEVLKGHEERRHDAEESRDAAMAALWVAVDARLAEPLDIVPPERRTVQSARELATTARRVLTVQAEATDEDRAWRRCFQQMQDLRSKLLPNRDARIADDEDTGGIQRVAVLAEPAAGWQAPDLAADALAQRVQAQRDGYDAEQQRVLTTLLGSTFIEHLKERLDYTAHTFARINDQLERHPTRHGNVVRVLWEADPADPDASAVVAALGRGYAELSTARQDMIRGFLARKIDEARSEATAGGAPDWKEELAQALDYRGWLRLSLQRRAGAGTPWSTFDAAKHGAKSGGEKVVLLSQPLFAAAVVAYDAAGPLAPRWVWLDEAMTGVDAAIKASFMGLTVDFELDVMLTAHDEWCKYSTVPAVAVYDLYRHEHLPGVDAMPYLWCGGELTAVDVDRLGVASDEGKVPSEGLFGDFGGDDA
ncbi:TIGR02680 family protein [Amycolatopsis mediterranei]|uniref:TIGR02680 family protein n=1 Tax=Amycolatopsis mediterranei TaxID=33910 RepID=UPI003437529A